MSATRRYARVARTPQVSRLLTAALLARLPLGIHPLALLLFVRGQGGSFALAGLVGAAFAVGSGLLTPLKGRLVDHRGHAPVMVPLAAAHAAALTGVLALGLGGAPAGTLTACAFAAGATLPSVGAVVRPLLADLLADAPELQTAAFALDGILIELVFISGPLLTALVASALSPAAALACAGAFTVTGAALLLASPASRTWRPVEGVARHPLGALASRGLRTVVVVTIAVGVAVGATRVAIVAFADVHGTRGAAGLLLGLWSAGSAVGGVVYGARGRAAGARAAWVRFALVSPLCALPLLLAPSIPVMLVLVAVAGSTMAPLLAASNQFVGDLAPLGTLTEAFILPTTALVLGTALGSAGGGALVDASGWRLGFAAVVVASAVAGAMALGRRRTLAPPG